MTNINKRAALAIAAVVLALLGIASLVVYANGARDRAFAGTETVAVWQVVKEVPAGTEANALGDSIEKVKLPQASVPGSALKSLDDVRGDVTTASLVPGEVLVAGRFGSEEEAKGSSGGTAVPKGMQEVTIELSSNRALSGTVKPGDTVGVLASYDGETNFAVNKVLVLAVSSKVPNEQTGITGNVQVRLALPPVSIAKVVNASEYGKVWLSRQNKDAEVERQRITSGNVLK
jgi:pilus assembly protein CpaB